MVKNTNKIFRNYIQSMFQRDESMLPVIIKDAKAT